MSVRFFFVVPEVLPGKTRSRYPEKLLYVDDLTLAFKTLADLRGKLEALEGNTWSQKGLRMNVKNKKMGITSVNTGKVTKEREFACATC